MTTPEAAIRSREGDEELQHSTKKVKENHNNVNRPDNTSPQVGERRDSYKERLTGEVPGAYEPFKFEHDMETEVEYDDESSDIAMGIAAVNLYGARKANIKALWSNALIIKVIGKTIGTNF